MTFTIEGNDYTPPLSGVYLVIFVDNKEIHVVSVPSPILADRFRDSVSDNYDEFTDANGNEFSTSVCSSKVGVDWQLDITPGDNEKDLENRIVIEYRPNDF